MIVASGTAQRRVARTRPQDASGRCEVLRTQFTTLPAVICKAQLLQRRATDNRDCHFRATHIQNIEVARSQSCCSCNHFITATFSRLIGNYRTNNFIARQHAMHTERDIVMENPSVQIRPSVCLSVCPIVSKRMDTSSHFMTIWQGPAPLQNSKRNPG